MLNSFFKVYSSNTAAGCANQHYFLSDGKPICSRAYFKIAVGGEYNYSLLFSGILDSSYRRISFHDEECAGWTIHSARVGRLSAFPSAILPGEHPTEWLGEHTMGEHPSPEWLGELSFGGEHSHLALPELFATDPLKLSFSADEYLCLELNYSGEKIPCHPESAIPIYTKTENGWEYSKNMPLPCMIGCDRPIKERISYLGDSITQGADMPINCYGHWMAKLSGKLPSHYSHWNLGIGLGKCSDVTCQGVWYQKGATADTVFICYGVNDINADKSADVICSEIYEVVSSLKALGKRVILQAVPPFNYPPERKAVWEKVNSYILSEMPKLADAVFNPNRVLSKSADEPHIARFGGHPSEEGCILWAEALYKEISHLFP